MLKFSNKNLGRTLKRKDELRPFKNQKVQFQNSLYTQGSLHRSNAICLMLPTACKS